MLSLSTLDIGACILAAVVVVLALWRWARANRASFPPGPPGWPLIGNALDFNPLAAWTKFTEWKAVYGAHTTSWIDLTLSLTASIGDLVGLNVLGMKILVLNSHKAVSDLLEKRGNVYSDRPVFIAVGELMGLNRVRPAGFFFFLCS